jgi:hypothetical protein
MRTTLVLDDDIARAARHRAVEEGVTLGELVSRALRELLASEHRPAAVPFAFPRHGDGRGAVRHTPAQLAALLAEQDGEG